MGIGKDAVTLTEKFGLNNACFANGVCKIGIPVSQINKMLKKIINKNISVVIYDYNPKGIERKNGEKYELLRRIVMKPIHEERKCLECEKCNYYDKRAKSNIANTEEILKGIDNVLEEKGNIIDIKPEDDS